MRRLLTAGVSRRWLGAGLALALVAGAVPALEAAQRGPGRRGFGPMGRGGPGGPMMMFGLRELNLTEEQRAQGRAIMERHRDDLRAIGERTRTARQSVHDAVTAEGVNEDAIRSAHAALAEVEADSAVLRARIRQEMWGLLTEEQREKARSMQADRERRMEERRQRMEERLKQRQEG